MSPETYLHPGRGRIDTRRGLCLVFFLATLALAGQPRPGLAYEFNCELGEIAIAQLGEGVSMRTCMWEKTPGQFIRTGRFELVKNGILILQSQTNRQGKLHGKFTAWSDAGVVIDQGEYVQGLKHGNWLETDKQGNSKTLVYHEGKLVQP